MTLQPLMDDDIPQKKQWIENILAK